MELSFSMQGVPSSMQGVQSLTKACALYLSSQENRNKYDINRLPKELIDLINNIAIWNIKRKELEICRGIDKKSLKPSTLNMTFFRFCKEILKGITQEKKGITQVEVTISPEITGVNTKTQITKKINPRLILTVKTCDLEIYFKIIEFAQEHFNDNKEKCDNKEEYYYFNDPDSKCAFSKDKDGKCTIQAAKGKFVEKHFVEFPLEMQKEVFESWLKEFPETEMQNKLLEMQKKLGIESSKWTSFCDFILWRKELSLEERKGLFENSLQEFTPEMRKQLIEKSLEGFPSERQKKVFEDCSKQISLIHTRRNYQTSEELQKDLKAALKILELADSTIGGIIWHFNLDRSEED